jgi:hypothetical protein
MAEKVWTAEELEAMTPAEQDAIFESSLVDTGAVPEAFVERVRRRALARIENAETPRQ